MGAQRPKPNAKVWPSAVCPGSVNGDGRRAAHSPFAWRSEGARGIRRQEFEGKDARWAPLAAPASSRDLKNNNDAFRFWMYKSRCGALTCGVCGPEGQVDFAGAEFEKNGGLDASLSRVGGRRSRSGAAGCAAPLDAVMEGETRCS